MNGKEINTFFSKTMDGHSKYSVGHSDLLRKGYAKNERKMEEIMRSYGTLASNEHIKTEKCSERVVTSIGHPAGGIFTPLCQDAQRF